jgi:AraC-like DNA-binding protein
MYNIPLNRYGGYDFLAIKVVLQPGILFCLTGMPVQELANTFIDAEALWGKEVRLVLQQLADVQELKQMLTILDNFFEYLFKHRLCKTLHPVDKAGRFIIYQQRASTLEWLADQSCLSKRQFIRKFEQRQGISPKLFDRIVRFDRAYRMKNKFPEADWLYIALSCGYYDYQHLVKDYKEFTNFTPQSLFELERNTPERKFSIHEC